MAKVRFGELTKAEQDLFDEEIRKSKQQKYQNDNTELWPDDDDEAVQNYFKDKEE